CPPRSGAKVRIARNRAATGAHRSPQTTQITPKRETPARVRVVDTPSPPTDGGAGRIDLLGRIVVVGRKGRLEEDQLRGRRGRRVLSYLVLHRARPIARAELADALWGEALPAAWEPALRTVVSGLRRALETTGTGATVKSVSG